MSDYKLQPIEMYDYNRGKYPKTDENFDDFVSNWPHFKDRLTIFLGAGASVGAMDNEGHWFPTGAQLRNELWAKFMLSDAEKASFDYSNLGLMSLEHSASLIDAKVGRNLLIEHLQKRFSAKKTLWPHCVLPYLNPKAVFTTNYDRLIEDGWETARRFDNIQNLFQVFSPGTLPSYPGVCLFKPHGTVEHAGRPIKEGGLVITQFDYFEMIESHKELLKKFLFNMDSSCVLFIGYSFLDADIGSYIWALRKANKSIPWYAVFPRDDRDVRRMYSQHFDIRQINRRFHDFLADLDKSINFIPQRWKFGKTKKLQQDGLIG